MAKRLKAALVSDDEDRFSTVPDDILIDNILPLLPTKEAARTSILARRWRFLWLCVPGLDFDAFEDVPRMNLKQRGIFYTGLDEAASKYAISVDRVINTYRGTTPLRHFHVIFHLDSRFSSKINSWISFALAKGVGVLEIDCLRGSKRYPYYRFPSISPDRYPNLRLLKCLTLGGLSITSKSLNHLLEGTKSLERLELCDAACGGGLKLNVTGPMLRLKTIRILRCNVKCIIISGPTPDLASFIYPRFVETLHLGHAPKLVDLLIGENTQDDLRGDLDLISHPLFHYISQLEALHLVILSWEMAVHWLPHLPDLSRLKHLKLTLLGFPEYVPSAELRPKLRGVASLINAASCLHHLTLEVEFIKSRLTIRKGFADLNLPHVRMIEISGFRGRGVDRDLVLCLIKAAAASLKKVIIDCRSRTPEVCYYTFGYESEKKREKWKSRAKELFEQELPSDVELVLLSNYTSNSTDRRDIVSRRW